MTLTTSLIDLQGSEIRFAKLAKQVPGRPGPGRIVKQEFISELYTYTIELSLKERKDISTKT